MGVIRRAYNGFMTLVGLKIRVSAVRYLQMRAPLSVRLDRRPGVDVVGVVEVRQFVHGGLKATELFVHA